MEPADLRRCPSCGVVAVPDAAVRQGTMIHPLLEREVGVIDIGFRCRSCNHEWGFEILKEVQTNA